MVIFRIIQAAFAVIMCIMFIYFSIDRWLNPLCTVCLGRLGSVIYFGTCPIFAFAFVCLAYVLFRYRRSSSKWYIMIQALWVFLLLIIPVLFLVFIFW
jgi:hypothetical protein